MTDLLDLSLVGSEAVTKVHRSAFEKLQGYCLVSHGRDNVCLALLRFIEADNPTLRSVIADYGTKATPALNLYESYEKVKSKSRDDSDYQSYKASLVDSVVTAVGLSSRGYDSLKVPESAKPSDAAFREGFAKRLEALVSDIVDPYDAVIIFAGNDRDQLRVEEIQLREKLAGLADVVWELGSAPGSPASGQNTPVDHFGFRGKHKPTGIFFG